MILDVEIIVLIKEYILNFKFFLFLNNFYGNKYYVNIGNEGKLFGGKIVMCI